MYVVLLRFSANSSRAAEHMADHQAWIKTGVEDGVFLLVGSIRPGLGGAILATNIATRDLRALVDADPFVVHDVVTAEIIDIDPNLTDPRLAFLTD
ncbi:MAG: hypothetical protein QM638_17245 [Nocardioides sp.]|uniref:YciI family protein n=1 Tax=Nocardioides sp. TaxID=35761 RepID=UPI0039E713B3